MKRLAIFAKPPVPGRVKTRLSPALPAGLACDLYRGMLADALDAATRASADERFVYWTEPITNVATQPPKDFASRVQRGDDLGARLEAAFGDMLRKPGDRAIVIGADCPDLDAENIDRAFGQLERNQLVLGPARDGGYYLIGLSATAPELFRDVSWGTESVLAETLTRVGRLKIKAATLEILSDLDTPQDLIGLIGRLLEPAAPGRIPRASHSRAALEAMGLFPELRTA